VSSQSLILPEIDLALCDGCGACVPACRPGALAVVNGKAALVQPKRCEYDGSCEPVCPHGAISLPYLVIIHH
jgi:MinD superfamily P-loop ATPase